MINRIDAIRFSKSSKRIETHKSSLWLDHTTIYHRNCLDNALLEKFAIKNQNLVNCVVVRCSRQAFFIKEW